MDTTKPQVMHVVFSFTKTGNDIVANPPVQVASAWKAENLARMLISKHAGVVALSRTFVPDTGDYRDLVVLARLGTIPDWFDETGDVNG